MMKVDLEEEIGIPLPSPENGSKVPFTTRSKKVCGRMGCHDVEVKHLDPEKAWELFRQKVRGTTLDSDPKILELAKKICEKCKGLPLALNVIGETMACKTSVREWQCAIDDLNTNAADYPEEEEEKVIVKTGAGVHQMPEVRDWNSVRRMSLTENEIQNISISISPVCHNLTTLLLKHNNLENISGTGLENLPAGLGKLIQLRYLALIGVQTLQSISVVSSLVNIEMLWLNYTAFVSLELIEDMTLMKNLKSLGVSINDVVVLERLLSIPSLASCIEHIFIEGIVAEYVPFVTNISSLRSIEIGSCIISDIMEHTRYGFRSTSTICFQNLVYVHITGVSGIQDLSWLIFAPNLTFVCVDGPSLELKEIVSREKVSGILNEGSSIVPFRKLHTIELISLVELESIYWKRLEFPSLKKMMIIDCPKLKKLPFSKERAYYFDLRAHNEEWFGSLEWEHEATED
ncbi:hypothetical protein Bca52824_075978 [Brassica carinata]|uniref:NB-ARC domain-containing protein n=1 Tax=Brassica carinata TaxID=52824 RepID=A0A8X7PQN9_BRACI|nr:hypothetical protein Bca52824_075978 [Brassica carinata]